MAAPGYPPQPSARDIAVAAAGAAAAAAAEAKAARRKVCDDAADAVGAQAQACEEAELLLRQSRGKLEELERASHQAHQTAGLQPTEAGTAMRWNLKGFGFIQPRNGNGPGGAGDLFCHCSDILDGTQLKEGGAVRFVRIHDEFKMKYRAAEVTGGLAEEGAGAAEEAASAGAAGAAGAAGGGRGGAKRGRDIGKAGN